MAIIIFSFVDGKWGTRIIALVFVTDWFGADFANNEFHSYVAPILVTGLGALLVFIMIRLVQLMTANTVAEKIISRVFMLVVAWAAMSWFVSFTNTPGQYPFVTVFIGVLAAFIMHVSVRLRGISPCTGLDCVCIMCHNCRFIAAGTGLLSPCILRGLTQCESSARIDLRRYCMVLLTPAAAWLAAYVFDDAALIVRIGCLAVALLAALIIWRTGLRLHWRLPAIPMRGAVAACSVVMLLAAGLRLVPLNDANERLQLIPYGSTAYASKDLPMNAKRPCMNMLL